MNTFLKTLLIGTCVLLASYLAKGEDVCECIKIRVHAPDTIKRNTYLNYKFTLKNTCSTKVWVNTGYFGFAFYHTNGTIAPKLRELTFVKRYQYPEFVLIAPNAEYEFKYADDPFLEYKLQRRIKYLVGLRYNNAKVRHPSGKNENYLCKRELRRSIYVK